MTGENTKIIKRYDFSRKKIDRDYFTELYNQDLNLSAIGRKLGVSKTTVNRKIKKWNLPERDIDRQRKMKWHNYRKQSFVLKKNGKRTLTGRQYPEDYIYTERSAVIKRAKRIRGDKCEICGWDKATVDGHHKISINIGGYHRLDNIVLLCPNCHRLVHNGIIKL